MTVTLLLALAASCSVGWGQATGGHYILTKDLPGATGTHAMIGGTYWLAFAWGEPVAGNILNEPTYAVISGYYGGRYGNWQTFKVASSRVGAAGAKAFFQDSLQVGVAFDAPVEITFSDELLDISIPAGIQVFVATDHLGRFVNTPIPIEPPAYDPVGRQVTIKPQNAWQGNTLYDVAITPSLQSIDSFPLDRETHVWFATMLDPHQENVVLHPMVPPQAASAGPNASASAMSIRIPADALSDLSMVLVSRDPLHAPLQADPQIIQEATRKAGQAGGPYRAPLAIQEINVYNSQGERIGSLAKPAEISIDYAAGAVSGLIRPRTLALWVLDEEHRLWVKIPASQNAAALSAITAPVSRFSVFALMGGPDGSASGASVFPVPWRPHGPSAGTGAGQTGTEAGGLTFSNLPSECRIRIYTIAGELVRELRHSDASGLIAQEHWDAKTTRGDRVASGVYLWRAESSVDGKNGKLMVIR